MPGYVYNGELRGELDPWAPKPKREPAKPREPREPWKPAPCGTYRKYGWHRRRGEKCDPCWEAKRAYDRERRRPQRTTPEQKARKAAYDRARYLRKKEEGKA